MAVGGVDRICSLCTKPIGSATAVSFPPRPEVMHATCWQRAAATRSAPGSTSAVRPLRAEPASAAAESAPGPRGHVSWSGIILAGGDGIRLRPLTGVIAGDERPKQFCAIRGESLLAETRRRLALAVAPERTWLVLTREHEPYYAAAVANVPGPCVVVQPENRGTGAAILYGLLRVAVSAPTAAVVISPSDHYVDDDRRFMGYVRAGFDAVERRPELIVVLGVTPDYPEVEYGWIEPGEAIPFGGAVPVYRVRRFWEKPPLPLAKTLLSRACLWNSFVMVGRAPAFLSLIRAALPALDAAFAPVRSSLGTPDEPAAVEQLYRRLAPASFARAVLTTRPANLAVMPVDGLVWSDWGQPQRVLATLARIGVEPAWAKRLA